jgi:glycosyltransferase involved in cell wall biosynthesis
VLPNGIDVERFVVADPRCSRAALARGLGLTPADRLVLLPGLMRPGKGHDELLDALPALLHSVPRARVLFAGSGCQEERLRTRAAPFSDRVCFLGHREDMPELMAASDVVVLPSRAEALPTVLMEAAAAGRPVVATSVGGVPEVVEADGSGVLVPPGQPAALATALADVLTDEPRARRLGWRARELARERFTVDRQLGATLGVWEDVVREARR